MRLCLAGLPFSVIPDQTLSPAELEALNRLAGSANPREDRQKPCELRVSEWPGSPPRLTEDGESLIEVNDGVVELKHQAYQTRFEPGLLKGHLQRDTEHSYPLEISLRIALCCRLPAAGGIALHAAGINIGDAGVAFFGPSGAGKSTLSRRSPYPVFSDELIALCGDPWELRATGFWGELEAGPQVPQPAPLAGLVELAKGPETRIYSLAPADALRRLLSVVVLPPDAPLWQDGMGQLSRLVETVRAFRMEWCPERSPWNDLSRIIDHHVNLPKTR
ncbi:MAG: hypothetical protein DRJ65_07775 [Acidobacteria bacterium]|nr:MAG: hypothetical protein DRJ65_07775 [Acidobacteriota bacterium]